MTSSIVPRSERRGRDGFTAAERASQLFLLGYRCDLRGIIGLHITGPEKQQYNTDPRQRLCTCPSFSFRYGASCKHTDGALKLASDQAHDMCWKAVDYRIEAGICREKGMDEVAAELDAVAVRLEEEAGELYTWIDQQTAVKP